MFDLGFVHEPAEYDETEDKFICSRENGDFC